ncbi:MAG: envelope stress response membrane protein PspC [Pseudomonadota bacterium]
MSRYEERRRFYRTKDNKRLAGVCGGIAEYFGFDPTMVRLLTIIALFLTGPIVIVLYIGMVLLVPSRNFEYREPARDEFRRSLRESPHAAVTDVKRALLRLDNRLARMERYVTSSRYELDRKINRL